MVGQKNDTKVHTADLELADYLADILPVKDRARIEAHVAECGECLARIASAHESVKEFRKGAKSGKGGIMNKINLYLVFAILTFLLSFAMPRYFIQLLVVTVLLGIKWIVDSKTTKMLVMIYEAWKNGSEKEASRILETFDSKRF